MRSAWRGVVVGVVIVLLLGAIATRAGWIAVAPPRPHGVGPWMVSRALGLVAFVALAAEVVAGLALSTRAGDRVLRRGTQVELHTWLSPLALGLVAAHAGVLLLDRYARLDLIDLVVPFASRTWTIGLGLGVLAAYLALVVHASFALRRRIGMTAWRRLHALAFVALALGAIHAVAVGTDLASPPFAISLAVALAAVAVLIVRRVRRVRATAATG